MDLPPPGERTGYDDALARVLNYRERVRRRSPAVRMGLAVLGAALLIGSIPLLVLLPEFGLPVLLAALRFLAVEVDWAARAYAWVDWRFLQARHWYNRQSMPTRAVVVVGLMAVAGALIWLLIHGLS